MPTPAQRRRVRRSQPQYDPIVPCQRAPVCDTSEHRSAMRYGYCRACWARGDAAGGEHPGRHK